MSFLLKKDIFFNIISTFFLFLLIFDLKIVGSLGSSFIVLLVCCFFLIINHKKYTQNIHDILVFFSKFLIIYFIFFTYILIRFLFSDLDDISYLLTTLKTTSILLASLFYLSIFGRSNLSKNLFFVFLIASLICLFFGTFPNLKFLIYPFKYGDDIENALIGGNEYRDAFLAGSSYFGISSLYGLAFSYLLMYCLEKRENLYYLYLGIIAIAGIFAGRVAIICYLIAVLYFLIFKRKFKVLIFSILFFVLFLIALNFVPAFEAVKVWFNEMFANKSVGESESVTQFKDVLRLPENQFTLLFGDARYGNSSNYYGGSDSGFIRNILFGGLLYLSILLITLLSIFDKVLKKSFSLLLILISCFLHFKGVFIFNNPGFFGVLLIVVFILNQKKSAVK